MHSCATRPCRRFGGPRALSILGLLAVAAPARAGNALWIGYNPTTRACEAQTTGFFNCILGRTDFNRLATGYVNGESLAVGGTADVSCADGDFQCVVTQGRFSPAPYDIVMQMSGTSWHGGWNGWATLSVGGRAVYVNTAFVQAGNSCAGQTCLAAHEAFEAATDGISADCCNGQVGSKSCPQCDKSCGRDDGNGGDPPWGCYPLSCGGTTYYMELVSQSAATEFDVAGCTELTPTGGGGAPNPCSAVPAGEGGLYCGTSTENGFSGGIASDLYDCEGGQVASATACPYGCTVEPSGMNDACNPAPKDPCATASQGGLYCGLSRENGFGGGDPDALYLCNAGKTESTTPCPYGCTVEPSGQNDRCNPPPPDDGGFDEGDAGEKVRDAGAPDAGLPDAGAAPDAGTADAGDVRADGGAGGGGTAGADAGAALAADRAPSGCGCATSDPASLLALAGAVLWALRRRARPSGRVPLPP